jgi:hypothetical protein
MAQAARPNLWGGESGEIFAASLRAYLAARDIAGDVRTRRVKPEAAPPGAYLLTAEIAGGLSVSFEVVDWAGDVLVIDPNGENMNPAQAIRYLGHRIDGAKPRDALRQALRENQNAQGITGAGRTLVTQ